MRKLFSLFLAFMMVLSLATAVSAATEDMNAELFYDVAWDDEMSCYVLTAYLGLDSDLDVAKASNRFTGSGLYSYMVTFNGVSAEDFAFADEDYFGDPLAADWAGPTLGDGFLTFGGSSTGKANGITAAKAPVELFALYVNGDSEDAIIAKFSDLGYTAFKIATLSSKAATYNIVAADITTYAVGDDGVAQHVDADYVVVTPESKLGGGSDDEEGPTVIVPTAATLTDVVESTEKAGWQKGQAVAMSFNVADLASFAGMNWKLNLATAGAKYAPVAFDAATIAAIGTPEVQFVASFVVNTEADVDGDVIDSVEAGFCDADKALVAKTAPVAITALN